MSRQPALALRLAGLTLAAGCSFLVPAPEGYTGTYECGVDATGTTDVGRGRYPSPER